MHREVTKYYVEEIERLDKLNDEIDSKIEELKSNHSKSNVVATSKTLKRISIICEIEPPVEGNEHSIPKIIINYVVSNASWSPLYDIRVDTVQNTLKLLYLANVNQCTGENWDECDLLLSTSNPSIGSSPPPLTKRYVSFEPTYHYNAYRSSELMEKSIERNGSFSLMHDDNADLATFGGGGINQMNAVVATVKGSGEVGSTCFTIPRKCSINSSKKSTKVTITQLLLIPQIVHYTAPGVDTAVYVQSQTKNTSNFPLLPSSDVSIFIDGNFISNSSLAQTNPGEKFQIYLGVDPTIKIEHEPCKVTSRTKGWFSGSALVKKYEYNTTILNTKSTPVRLIIAQTIPISTTDKLIVDLVEPTPTQTEANISNAANILDEIPGQANGNDESNNGTYVTQSLRFLIYFYSFFIF